mgnify:CR=1 FL=1
MSGPGVTPAQLSLRCGAMSLDVTSAGGACTALRWQAPGFDAFDVLQPRAAQSEERFEQPSFALVPYSNRLFDGQLITPAGAVTLPGNHPLHPIPIHGVAWRTDWQTRQTGQASATLHYRHKADAHWPFAHECTQQRVGLRRSGWATRLPRGEVLLFSAAMALFLATDRADYKPSHAAVVRFFAGDELRKDGDA